MKRKTPAPPSIPQIPRRPTRDAHLHVRIERPKLERWRKSAELAGTDLTSWVEHHLDLAVAHGRTPYSVDRCLCGEKWPHSVSARMP